MNRISTHLPAIAASVVVTLSLLVGIDTLAVQEHAASDIAAAAAQVHMAAAKAPQPRS
ncbi:MAG: hypothetical protein AB1430_25320 [Pseudomonadota bacterium]